MVCVRGASSNKGLVVLGVSRQADNQAWILFACTLRQAQVGAEKTRSQKNT